MDELREWNAKTAPVLNKNKEQEKARIYSAEEQSNLPQEPSCEYERAFLASLPLSPRGHGSFGA